jgi:HAD superfamily hydrolase (TIGR01490 family)
MKMTKAIALFDLDYTLLDVDSEEYWSNFLFKQGLVPHSFVERIEAYYRDYDAGNLDFTAYEEFLLSSLVAIPGNDLAVIKQSYLAEIATKIRPWMRERVDWHLAQGHELVLITAANEFLAEGISDLLRFTNMICTRVEKSDGRYTGKITGTPAFKIGKVTLLTEWLAQRQESLSGSWGYSDSFNDLPLLSIVENPVAVRPDARLRAHALLHGWGLLEN